MSFIDNLYSRSYFYLRALCLTGRKGEFSLKNDEGPASLPTSRPSPSGVNEIISSLCCGCERDGLGVADVFELCFVLF